MKVTIDVLSILTMGASVGAVMILYQGFRNAESAIQEATACTLAVAVVVIPYVLTRCFEMIKND